MLFRSKALRAETGIAYDDRAQGTLQLFRTQKQLDGIGGDVDVLRQYGVPFEVLDREAEEIVNDIGIPPCPALLTKLMREMRSDEPDFVALGKLIGSDVSLAAAMLKTVNSPFYGLRTKATSVQQAITYLGTREVAAITYEVIVIDDASTDGTPEIVRRYTSAHSDMPITLHVNEKNAEGRTPLHVARGNSAVRLLLKTGANVNEKAAYDITPLIIKSNDGDANAVQALLEAGAEFNARSIYLPGIRWSVEEN